MKKINILKFIQLITLSVLTLISIILLFQPSIKNFVFSNVPGTIIFIIIWFLLIVNFIFLLFDFSFIASLKLNYKNLYEVAYSDSTSGIPNRFSCDVLIEKYSNCDLPANIGCMMIDLINLPETNSIYEHNSGNQLIKQFSQILSSCAVSLCFVGRNGGNKFLAIFENCNQEKMDTFTKRLERKIDQHNSAADTMPIKFKYGMALNSEAKLSQITQLIALANQRIYEDE